MSAFRPLEGMAEKENELQAEKETSALKKLQAAAGFVDKSSVERLDWMYEQSYFEKPDHDKLMNTPVADQKDKDLQDVKNLQESTAGSLFLKSATKTTEDMLRKLREDPLFQIRRQEEAARANMMSNPLVVARLKNKAEKQAKKADKKAKKKAKKAEKKQKKALHKLAKAQNKLKKKKKASSSSSDSDDSSSSSSHTHAPSANIARSPARRSTPPMSSPHKRRRDSPPRSPPRRKMSPQKKASPPRSRARDEELGPSVKKDEELGPSVSMVSKREEYETTVAQRKEAALASRGAPRRMSEDEKRRRLEQMQADAQRHEKGKDFRIADAERRDKEIEDREKEMRNTSNQKYFREIRQEAYMGDSSGNIGDRIRNQRHRRQKNMNDPLERES